MFLCLDTAGDHMNRNPTRKRGIAKAADQLVVVAGASRHSWNMSNCGETPQPP